MISKRYSSAGALSATAAWIIVLVVAVMMPIPASSSGSAAATLFMNSLASIAVNRNGTVRGVAVAESGDPEIGRVLFLAYPTQVVLYFLKNQTYRPIMGKKDVWNCSNDASSALTTSGHTQPDTIEVINDHTILFADMMPHARIVQMSTKAGTAAAAAAAIPFLPHTARVLQPVGNACNYSQQMKPLVDSSEPSAQIGPPEFTLYLSDREELYFSQYYCIAQVKQQTVTTFFANCTHPGSVLDEWNNDPAPIPRRNATTKAPSQMVVVGNKLFVAERVMRVIREISLDSDADDTSNGGALVVVGNITHGGGWPPPACHIGSPCTLLGTSFLAPRALAAVIDPINETANHTILYIGDSSTGVIFRADLNANEVLIIAGQMLHPGFVDGMPNVSALSAIRQFAITSDTLYIADGHLRDIPLGKQMIVPKDMRTNRQACTIDNHCSGRAVETFGLPPIGCTCVCRHSWAGATCNQKTTHTTSCTISPSQSVSLKKTRTRSIRVLEPLPSCDKSLFEVARQPSGEPDPTEGQLQNGGMNVTLLAAPSAMNRRFFDAATRGAAADGEVITIPAKLIQAPRSSSSSSIGEGSCLVIAPDGGYLNAEVTLMSPEEFVVVIPLPFRECEMYIGEEAAVMVSAEVALGRPCTAADGDVMIGLFSIAADADPVLAQTNQANTATTVISAIGSLAGGGVSVVDQQALAVAAMMYCGGTSEKKMLANYRLLAPLAPEQSFAGVIWGNLILIGAVLVIQAIIIAIVHKKNMRDHDKEVAAAAGIGTPPEALGVEYAMATSRFPSIPHKVVVITFQGTSFAAFQLMVMPKSTIDTSIGACFAFGCVAYLVFLMWYSYTRIEGDFLRYRYEDWRNCRFPKWFIVGFCPIGVWSPHTFRRRFAGWVTSIRREERFWVTTPMWGAALMSIASLFRLQRAGCMQLFAIIGGFQMILGITHIVFRPHRSLVLNFLSGLGSFTIGSFLALTASNISEPTHFKVLIILHVAQFQMALTLVRVILTLGSILLEHRVLRKADSGLMTKLLFRWVPRGRHSTEDQAYIDATQHNSRITRLNEPLMQGANTTRDDTDDILDDDSDVLSTPPRRGGVGRPSHNVLAAAAIGSLPPFPRVGSHNSDLNILGSTPSHTTMSPGQLDSALGSPTSSSPAFPIPPPRPRRGGGGGQYQRPQPSSSEVSSYEEQMKAIEGATFLEAEDDFFIPEGEFVSNESRISKHKHELHEVLRKGLNSQFRGSNGNLSGMNSRFGSTGSFTAAGYGENASLPGSPTGMNRQTSSVSGGSTGFDAGSFALRAAAIQQYNSQSKSEQDNVNFADLPPPPLPTPPEGGSSNAGKKTLKKNRSAESELSDTAADDLLNEIL